MVGDKKRLNWSFIGFSSDESSVKSPSTFSIEGTPLKLRGGLTLIGSQMKALTHSHQCQRLQSFVIIVPVMM